MELVDDHRSSHPALQPAPPTHPCSLMSSSLQLIMGTMISVLIAALFSVIPLSRPYGIPLSRSCLWHPLVVPI